MSKPISTEEKYIKIHNTTYLYFVSPIENFDKSKVIFSSEIKVKDTFELLYALSVDGVNYSTYVKIETLEIPMQGVPLYLSILFKEIVNNGLNPTSLQRTENVDSREKRVDINSFSYDGVLFDLFDENVVKYATEYQHNKQDSRWNLYDNQDVNVREWLQRCNSDAEINGHKSVYFRTTALDKSHIFRAELNREVVAIKLIPVSIPNNEYSNLDEVLIDDFDTPLLDDFIIRIVCDKYRKAFGDDAIPNQKDYLYIPFLNKMFSVLRAKPIPKFMGKIAWWEIYLGKYSDDDSVAMSKEVSDYVDSIPEFEQSMDRLKVGEVYNIFADDIQPAYEGNIIDQVESYKQDTVLSSEKLLEQNIQEKRDATENYGNSLVDSNLYISIKESDKIREYYDQRLSIISVNPSTNAFPVNMFDCRPIDTKVVAMQYKFDDFTQTTKNSLLVDKKFEFSFDFVLLSKFTSNLFTFLNETGNSILVSVVMNRNKICISSNITSTQEKTFEYELNLKELYRVELKYDVAIHQFSVNIYTLIDKMKSLVFNDIYIIESTNVVNFTIGYLHLYGGKHLCSSIEYKNNEKQIMKDYCHPLLSISQKL